MQKINDTETTEVVYKDIKLDVPYFSQYVDIQDGGHRLRACGMTSAYMILKYFGVNVPSLDEMVERGMREGGYGPSGWKHDYFVTLFREYGFSCERQENMRDKDIEIFRMAIKNGNPVIISVTLRLWDQRNFHMLVLTGIRENINGELEGFFYHDPASLKEGGARHFYVPVPLFFTDWRRMAILPSRKV
jgi:uncharacterized protein YvpB